MKIYIKVCEISYEIFAGVKTILHAALNPLVSIRPFLCTSMLRAGIWHRHDRRCLVWDTPGLLLLIHRCIARVRHSKSLTFAAVPMTGTRTTEYQDTDPNLKLRVSAHLFRKHDIASLHSGRHPEFAWQAGHHHRRILWHWTCCSSYIRTKRRMGPQPRYQPASKRTAGRD